MLKFFNLQKSVLIKGWLISTLIVFPFTFLPVLSKEGELIENLIQRIPQSLLYASGFSFFLVLMAFYYNYEKVKVKLELFGKRAFRELGFVYAFSGQSSIVSEFSVFLKGYHNGMQYRVGVDVDFDDLNKKILAIEPIPDIDLSIDYPTMIKAMKRALKRDFILSHDPSSLEIHIDLVEEHLDDPQYIFKQFTLIESILARWNK